MLRRTSVWIGVGICFLAAAAGAKKGAPGSGIAAREQKIAALRAEGPEGLAEALRAYDRLLQQKLKLQDESRLTLPGIKASKGPKEGLHRRFAELNAQLERMQATIDLIGGQRGCAVSRLYWHTDLAAAETAAARTGRPILSLRMLGKLTDEYSCANSRFFRTALYSNTNISNYLRDHFVLHWQSVRPVPRVTIDFGDGRKLERTLTGNSAHYMLASDGTPLDMLPGLYSPQRFLSWLESMRDLHAALETAPAADRAKLVHDYHLSRRDALLAQWDRDIEQLGSGQVKLVAARIDGAIEAAKIAGQEIEPLNPPVALVAAGVAVSKSIAEVPVLRFANLGGQWMEQGMDDNLWRSIANLHRAEVKLDEASVAVMQGEFPNARAAGQLAGGKGRIENPILNVVVAFEDSIGQDTVRNEYLLHRRIHEAFVEGRPQIADVDMLNEWVYAELFLTPSSDPWLGLAPPDVYTALENDGRIEATTVVLKRSGD